MAGSMGAIQGQENVFYNTLVVKENAVKYAEDQAEDRCLVYASKNVTAVLNIFKPNLMFESLSISLNCSRDDVLDLEIEMLVIAGLSLKQLGV
jgi:hypothetical protein